MSTPKSPPSLLGVLSTELLERIFLFTSPQDILRLSSVNRTCHNLVRVSPSIQYEIDLYAVGLQRNPRFEACIADCRVALAAHRTRWETLNPVEKWKKVIHGRDEYYPEVVAVSGVYGLRWEDCAKFLTLGSISRGVSRREWDIPFEDVGVCAFAFYPPANVVAIVGYESEETPWRQWRIQLRTLNDGEPHPSAQTSVLSHTFGFEVGVDFDQWQMGITSSRLALLCRPFKSPTTTAQLIVWDWTTGEIVLDLKNKGYQSAKFVDNFWIVLLESDHQPLVPPRFVFLDTAQKKTDDGELAQTTFHFDPSKHRGLAVPDLVSDWGRYQPPHEDGLPPPFYPDPSQKVFAVELQVGVFVMKIETLLRLAQQRKGQCLRWEEWCTHAVRVSRDWDDTRGTWVSDHRLFCVSPAESGTTVMDVYDFGAQASARHTETAEGSMTELSTSQILPWGVNDIIALCGCHDSITFLAEADDPLGYSIHTWNFV